MKKYIMEFIGTFFLVFTIGMSVIQPGAGTLAPLAIGAVLMVMIYAGGHISGAHYNPAVTLAIYLRGKCPKEDVAPYMAIQVAAAVVAGLLVKYFKGGSVILPMNLNLTHAFFAEVIFTFALAFVILNVATAKATEGNSYYGLAIGFTVLAGAFAVGGISGGVFNPAVAVGITVMGLSKAANIWVYLAANFLGGILAAVTFKKLVND